MVGTRKYCGGWVVAIVETIEAIADFLSGDGQGAGNKGNLKGFGVKLGKKKKPTKEIKQKGRTEKEKEL